MSILYSNGVPTLHFDTALDRWAMRMPDADPHAAERPEFSDWMLVCCAWTGETWFTYRFVRYRAGKMKELVTYDQLKERLEAIIEHEGEAAADIWMDGQDQVEVVNGTLPIFDLPQKWEAMITLGLFFPTVNNREWEGFPLDEDVKKRMDAARDAEQARARSEDV
jgi:hypothetical protein